ncbi:MFS transporter [Sphingobium sp. WCS2017Hpa-17]|uniref:MFS transporter n=1 Tax=Sphingobium sp. WCS2017Hpa-17 TaxID=3073638 RepID=UPI00288BA7E9|nr:MFS transporter [Sphingobium sp. WCS2017Hpa-17]
MTGSHGSKRSELRDHWCVILGSFLGLSVGVTSTIGYSHGALIAPLEADFGWSRAALSLGLTFYAIAILVTGPWWGALADRLGARVVATASLILYAVGMLSVPAGIHHMPFWLLYFLVSCLGAGSGAVTLIKPVADSFAAARGIAIGIAFASIGLSAFWVPRLAVWLTALGGWSLVFKTFAVLALLGAPLLWFLLPGRPLTREADQLKPSDSEGIMLGEAVRTTTFWMLMAIGLLLTIGLIGLGTHLIPMFHEAGASMADAAATASMLGLSSLAGRLLVGTLLDRLNGRLVALAVSLMAMSGIIILCTATGSASLTLVGVLLMGFAFGSEMDMIAYFASRYFGRRAFGAIYGWLGGVIAMGGGIGSLIAGATHDWSGDYQAAMLICAVLTGLAALLALRLGPYRYVPH